MERVGKRYWAVIGVVAALFCCPQGHAQKIPCAESGTIEFQFDPVATPSALVDVKKGGVAWDESARPAQIVRLLDDAPARIRPAKTAAVPSQTLLFGYKLSTGMAFCAPISADVRNGRVQCFRDLDADGAFDAGYVTRSRKSGSQYISAYVQGIASVAKFRFEPASPELVEPAELRVVFRGMKDGAPTFRVEIDDFRLIETNRCEPVSPGTCRFLGREVSYSPGEGSQIRVSAGPRLRDYIWGVDSRQLD